MGFDEKYRDICNLISENIDSVMACIRTYADSSDEIEQYVFNFINSPSKHMRAVVSFLYLRAYGIEINERQVLWQTVIELIHNGSLIHDDIIDSAEFRRGNKSVNKVIGNHLAVISGDYVLSIALKIIHELNCSELLRIAAETLSLMCKGEFSQNSSKYKIPALEEYIKKTYNKTAALFNAALKGAIILAGQEFTVNTEQFIKNFGIAFQLRDDIKNIVENSPDSDLKNGIYTAPVIFSKDTDNPSAGIEKAKDLLDNYLGKAKDSIADLRECEYKSALVELLELFRYE